MQTTATTSTSQYLSFPYPGQRPSFSYVLTCNSVLPLIATGPASSWRLETEGGEMLHDWLTRRGEASMTERVPVLSYGSNACPGKLAGMQIPGPVIMTECTTQGIAAVWCVTGRANDQVIPATLTACNAVEQHFIWWVAPTQWSVLDACEGRSQSWYDLVALRPTADRVVLDNEGHAINDVFAYVGARPERYPALDASGQPHRVAAGPAAGLKDFADPGPSAQPEPLGRHLPADERPRGASACP